MTPALLGQYIDVVLESFFPLIFIPIIYYLCKIFYRLFVDVTSRYDDSLKNSSDQSEK